MGLLIIEITTVPMKLKKYFLILIFCAVSIIALLYGVAPQWFALTFLGVSELDLDLCPFQDKMTSF